MSGGRFTIHESARASVDQAALRAFDAVRSLDIAPATQDSFQSDVVITASITDRDIVGEPVLWVPLLSGGMGFAFAQVDGVPKGLSEADFSLLRDLLARLLKIKWVQMTVSEQFIERCFVEWARSVLQGSPGNTFSSHFLAECERFVKMQNVWVPVQHLQIENAFGFGIATFTPITKTILDDYELRLRSYFEGDREKLEVIETDLRRTRNKIQGYAAVSVNIEAEHGFASEAARNICADAVGLLRLFSVASVGSAIYSPVDLLGASAIPTYTYFGLADGSIQTEGSEVLPKKVAHWRLRASEVQKLKSENLDQTASLLDIEALSEFGTYVRSAALAFSRSLTLPSLSDRVLFALSSVEGLLLKDGGEPIQQNVGDRMAFLIGSSADERMKIVENIKMIYGVRSKYIHHRVTAAEAEYLDAGFRNIRATIFAAIANLGKFKSRVEFLSAIERRKYS